MDGRTTIRVVVWSALTGSVVAFCALVLLDWMIPGEVTIAPAVSGDIVIMIDGAVATPGIVRLPAGSRLQAVVEAAGGLAPNADASHLNLAARIGDGEHITISAMPTLATPSDGGNGTPADSASSLININTSGVSELDQLPGVGPAIAQRIVDYRETNGPFDSVDELAEIDGISEAMVEELRPLVTTGE
ncbi:MAG: ComEA family DNA-binding protein [Chloroflexia bacterium]|nr:ComEA family DNA-binding protein [Chloroflexia bacterium]